MRPEAITPAVQYLLSEDAPTRTIMGAGAGSFAVIKIMETEGINLPPTEWTRMRSPRISPRSATCRRPRRWKRVPADPEIRRAGCGESRREAVGGAFLIAERPCAGSQLSLPPWLSFRDGSSRPPRDEDPVGLFRTSIFKSSGRHHRRRPGRSDGGRMLAQGGAASRSTTRCRLRDENS